MNNTRSGVPHSDWYPTFPSQEVIRVIYTTSEGEIPAFVYWLPHDDDLLIIAGKTWFFGDCEDGITKEILEEQHVHGHRSFIAILEQDPSVPEPFLLSFVFPRTAGIEDFPLCSEMMSLCSRCGNVASVRIADITVLSSTARTLEGKGYASPVVI